MKAQIKSNIKEGTKFTVYAQGQEFTGTMVKLDEINPAKITMIMDDDDGNRLLVPVNDSIIVKYSLVNVKDNDNDEDDEIDKSDKGKDDYEGWTKLELKTEVKDRELEFQRGISKKGLMNLLIYDDEQKVEKKLKRKAEKKAARIAKKKSKNKKKV